MEPFPVIALDGFHIFPVPQSGYSSGTGAACSLHITFEPAERVMAEVMASDEVVSRLRARIAVLERQLDRAVPIREKTDRMSSEVVDSNPYR